MKNKLIALLCATMLSVCCVGLAACGGSTSSASGSASGSESASSSADPTAKFIGEWKLAGAQINGVTVAGDFSMVFGTDVDMSLNIKDNGTAVGAFGGEETELTWEAKDDNSIVLKQVESEESSSSSASASASSASASDESGELLDSTELEAVYENDSLVIESETEKGTVRIIFTADGTIADMPVISADKAEKITDGDAVIGTWTLSAANFMGATMYGDMTSVTSMMGTSSTSDLTLVFNKDGSAELFGNGGGKWEIDAEEGLVVGDDSAMLPIKSLGDDIVLDMSDMVGFDMILVFAK